MRDENTKKSELIKGSLVNEKLIRLTSDMNQWKITRSDVPPEAADHAEIISSPESSYSIYLWRENADICWYSEAERLVFDNDSGYMFQNCSGLTATV
jgi:hypothetical protein